MWKQQNEKSMILVNSLGLGEVNECNVQKLYTPYLNTQPQNLNCASALTFPVS